MLEHDGMEAKEVKRPRASHDRLRVHLAWRHAQVRSLALHFLGTKALVLEVVPPAVTRWFPGFSGSGDADSGLRMLRSCMSEAGLFAPFAAHAILGTRYTCRDRVEQHKRGRPGALWLQMSDRAAWA